MVTIFKLLYGNIMYDKDDISRAEIEVYEEGSAIISVYCADHDTITNILSLLASKKRYVYSCDFVTLIISVIVDEQDFYIDEVKDDTVCLDDCRCINCQSEKAEIIV